jgi:hypothetical protein
MKKGLRADPGSGPVVTGSSRASRWHSPRAPFSSSCSASVLSRSTPDRTASGLGGAARSSTGSASIWWSGYEGWEYPWLLAKSHAAGSTATAMPLLVRFTIETEPTTESGYPQSVSSTQRRRVEPRSTDDRPCASPKEATSGKAQDGPPPAREGAHESTTTR